MARGLRKDWTQEELDALPRAREKAKATGSKHFFTGKPCEKARHVAARLASNATCVECQRTYARTPARQEYQKTSAYRDWEREYRKTLAVRERERAYQKTSKMRDYDRPFHAHRRALKLKATPPWLTAEHKEAIRAIYAEAARLTETTGIEHHVDHIVPLKATCPVTRGRIASGLHVSWNLQILTAAENQSKNCYFKTLF